MLSVMVSFRARHGVHQFHPAACFGGVKPGLFERVHCFSPGSLDSRHVSGCLQHEINIVRAMRLARAWRIVRGDQNFSEGFESLELFRREEFGLVVAEPLGLWRWNRCSAWMLVAALRGLRPGRKERGSARKGSRPQSE